MIDSNVTVTPTELRFRFELRKQIPVTLSVQNSNDVGIGFKVKTTNPKKYIVRPSTGVVSANSSSEVQVIMQAQKEEPADLSNCKDKFLVQTVHLPTEGNGTQELSPDMFSKENSANISEVKLRVLLVSPPAPPSPVPEGVEPEPSDESGRTKAGTVSQNVYSNTVDDLAAATKESNELKEQVKKLKQENSELGDKLQLLQMQSYGKPKAPSEPGKAVPGAAGFTLLHLILTAVICFLLGHFT